VTVSVIPSVIDALVARLQAATADPDSGLHEIQIIDGPPVEDVEGEFVAVGLQPEDVNIDADFTRSDVVQGTREDFSLICMCRSFQGATDIAARRRVAFDLLDAVDQAINADQSLGGACSQAWISRVEYRPRRRRGVQIALPFLVQVRQF
jgi:hypothetical protein